MYHYSKTPYILWRNDKICIKPKRGNALGVMPVVFIKLQNALKSIQPSSVEPERRFSTCWFYGTKVRPNLSDEILSNLPFLNRHFKKLSKSDQSQKKAEFKASKIKPMRVIQVTPKAKTKILSQKRKTPNDSSQKAKLIQKIVKKKTWLVTSLMVHWI